MQLNARFTSYQLLPTCFQACTQGGDKTNASDNNLYQFWILDFGLIANLKSKMAYLWIASVLEVFQTLGYLS